METEEEEEEEQGQRWTAAAGTGVTHLCTGTGLPRGLGKKTHLKRGGLPKEEFSQVASLGENAPAPCNRELGKDNVAYWEFISCTGNPRRTGGKKGHGVYHTSSPPGGGGGGER